MYILFIILSFLFAEISQAASNDFFSNEFLTIAIAHIQFPSCNKGITLQEIYQSGCLSEKQAVKDRYENGLLFYMGIIDEKDLIEFAARVENLRREVARGEVYTEEELWEFLISEEKTAFSTVKKRSPSEKRRHKNRDSKYGIKDEKMRELKSYHAQLMAMAKAMQFLSNPLSRVVLDDESFVFDGKWRYSKFLHAFFNEKCIEKSYEKLVTAIILEENQELYSKLIIRKEDCKEDEEIFTFNKKLKKIKNIIEEMRLSLEKSASGSLFANKKSGGKHFHIVKMKLVQSFKRVLMKYMSENPGSAFFDLTKRMWKEFSSKKNYVDGSLRVMSALAKDFLTKDKELLRIEFVPFGGQDEFNLMFECLNRAGSDCEADVDF